MAEPLLTPEFLRQLERVELLARKVLSGKLQGERRSRRKGNSVEFADHRPYVPGDDPRFIDWNILIRLDRLFLKLFEEEEELPLYLLIDRSASMDFGTPSKLRRGLQLLAALAFVGLTHNERVQVTPFAETLDDSLAPARGRAALWRVLRFLENITAASAGDLSACCRRFAARAANKGIVVLVSDFLDPQGYEAPLRYLSARAMDIFVIHLLSHEEVQPELTGDLQLRDRESGASVDVTISSLLLQRYQEKLTAYREQLRSYCVHRGITYLFTTTATPFEEIILLWLRERGLLR